MERGSVGRGSRLDFRPPYPNHSRTFARIASASASPPGAAPRAISGRPPPLPPATARASRTRSPAFAWAALSGWTMTPRWTVPSSTRAIATMPVNWRAFTVFIASWRSSAESPGSKPAQKRPASLARVSSYHCEAMPAAAPAEAFFTAFSACTAAARTASRWASNCFAWAFAPARSPEARSFAMSAERVSLSSVSTWDLPSSFSFVLAAASLWTASANSVARRSASSAMTALAASPQTASTRRIPAATAPSLLILK